MGKGKLGKDGWEVPEDNLDSKGIPVSEASKVSDKDAAKVGKYRALEKEFKTLHSAFELATDDLAKVKEYTCALEDKLLQVEEVGITFSDEGVLIAPEGDDKAAEGSEPADDPARP